MSDTETFEGRTLSSPGEAAGVTELRKQFDRLTQTNKNKLFNLVQSSTDAKGSISLSTQKTQRRFDIARGVIALIEDEQYDNDLIIAICNKIGVKNAATAGAAVAKLDATHAATFAGICYDITYGAYQVAYTEKGFIITKTKQKEGKQQ